MPMLLGTKGNDILQWRASADLIAALKGELARKGEQSPAGAAESFLEQFIGNLREEQEYEAQLSGELDALNEGLAAAASPAEVEPLSARYQEVVSAHFRRRRSVLTLCGLCNALHDALAAKALGFARERMLQLGQGSAPSGTLLVSGERGRGEQTLLGDNRYFLLHAEKTPRFLLFLRQVQASLQDLGLPAGEQHLWHGTLREWRDFAGGSFARQEGGPPETFLAALPPFAAPQKVEQPEMPGEEWRTAALADLAFLQGDPALAAEALAAAERSLYDERNREALLLLARRVVALPVALGRFGGWRLERSGEHKGELNLKEYALDPLVMTLRVLALLSGERGSGSVGRIQLLQEKGVLDVELAERLLQAYQVLMQLKVLLEMRGEERAIYCFPEEFSAETETRFRSALEAVLTLQKIASQRLAEQG
jgi:CBS domain-containing protein